MVYFFVDLLVKSFKLIIEVKLTHSKRDVHKFDAICKVDEEIVCIAELLGAVKNKNDT